MERDGCAAIEVYPSATKRVSRRASPAEELSIDLPSNQYGNEHVRDALWCAVAGMHFLRDECEAPSDMTVARREGWIWFRRGGFG